MTSIKGRFLKRLRSIPSIYTSKQHIVITMPFQCKSPERLSSSQNMQSLEHYTEKKDTTNTNEVDLARKSDSLEPTKEVDEFEDCECEFDDSVPQMVSSSSSSSSLSSSSSPSSSPFRTEFGDNKDDLEGTKELLDFKEKCPPGGSDKVVLYTTSLRGIRKTFEDCNAIKFLLDSFQVVYSERDVSMHLKYRDELWDILGGRIVPPKLFIKGRYIGGADEVVMLHEVGMLKKLMQGIPVSALSSNVKCFQCGGNRFLLCSDCNGSCKVYNNDEGNGVSLFVRCTNCNENGLIKCPSCSY